MLSRKRKCSGSGFPGDLTLRRGIEDQLHVALSPKRPRSRAGGGDANPLSPGPSEGFGSDVSGISESVGALFWRRIPISPLTQLERSAGSFVIVFLTRPEKSPGSDEINFIDQVNQNK